MFTTKEISHINTDVLIIGGGSAACRAAIEAFDCGASVTMIVKGLFGNSGCSLNVGTSASVGSWADPKDTNFTSMQDLISYGGYSGNQTLAKILVDETQDRINELISWGIDFDRNEDNSITVSYSAEHTYPRNVAFKDYSTRKHSYGYPPGIAIMNTLLDQVENRNIQVIQNSALIKLVKDGADVIGGLAVNYESDKLLLIKSKTTILATGTYSQIFSKTSVSLEETGDGHAIGYHAGAELIDMEVVNFVPSATGALPGAVFLNAKKEEFLHKHGINSLNNVTKEIFSAAIAQEIIDNGTERDTIYVDMTEFFKNNDLNTDNDIKSTQQGSLLDIVIENIKTYGTVWSQIVSSVPQNIPDPAKDLLETTPAAHTTIGGIVVNEKGETAVPMLYAAGAVAGGIYGHARPEGYTSMIPLVYGKRAGKSAAEMSLRTKQKDIDFEKACSSKNLLNITDADTKKIKSEIRNIMYSHCWVIRDNHTLAKGLNKIQKIANDLSSSNGKTHKITPKKLLEIYEIKNMLDCAEMMISGSLLRKETRGAFRRSDYPELDNENWLKNLRYKKINGQLEIYPTEVDLKYCKPDNV